MNDIKTDQLNTTTGTTDENKSFVQIPKIVIQSQIASSPSTVATSVTPSRSKKRSASNDNELSSLTNGNESKYARHENTATTATSDTYTYQDLEQELRASQQQQQQQHTQNVLQQLQPHANPNHSNTDEIFQLLSQRIAKYCQVLADLTNCEVFFKSGLQQRSLYWGTYKMMFNYTHQGLQYDRNESLIKINSRSLSTDVNNIVEELIGAEQLYELNASMNNAKYGGNLMDSSQSDTMLNDTASVSDYYNSGTTCNINVNTTNGMLDDTQVDFKDCAVYVPRLDESIYEQYLSKFEKTRVYIEEEPILNELTQSKDALVNTSEQATQELFQSNDELYMCEQCADHSYKHLPQLKIHVLKEHEKVPGMDTHASQPYSCPKCTLIHQDQQEFFNHLLLCYFPDLYTCKICSHTFATYSEYFLHTKYIHTQVFVCAECNRKFKNVKDLLDHDQLMHSKSLNYCEICYEPMKSRVDVHNHYKQSHMCKATCVTSSSGVVAQQIMSKNNHQESRLSQDGSSVMSESMHHGGASSLNDFNTIDLGSSILSETTSNIIQSSHGAGTSDLKTTLAKVQKNDLIRGLLDRKHQCKWCTQRFYTKSQLKQHESSHVNVTLFCPVCDKEFTHKDRLAGHMKCHMEPSLECKVCGKKFKRLCNLYNHELVHGLTEHAFMLCQFCGRGFRSRRDYQNHVIANHRDQLMKSEIIQKTGGSANVASAAAALVQNTITISNQLAAAHQAQQQVHHSPKQVTTTINGGSGRPRGRQSLASQNAANNNGNSMKSDSLTYFTHLTHGSNSTTVASFGDDDDDNDTQNNNNNSIDNEIQSHHEENGQQVEEEVVEEEEEEGEGEEEKSEQVEEHDDEENVQETKRARSHLQAKNKKSSQANNNTQLLVEAAEFVNNQSV